ncbi:MAG: hypothetical protein QOF48_1977 [Verrucomicrobiota bacterium]
MGSLRATTPREGRPGGYVSSDTCRSCHPSQHASWHHSFHRTMTQYASPESVRGNFQNISLSYAGKRYEFRERAGEFYCEMVDPDWEYVEILKRRSRDSPAPIAPAEYATAPRVEKRVGLVTGSHSMQAYWVSSRFGNMQFSLPFTHVLELSRWVPRNDVFLLDPQRPWIPDVWNVNCIQCHATAGQPRQDPKTAVIDSRAAELGISCEACHGPAEEHVRVNADPRRRYDFHADGKSDPTIFNPARADHIKSSETCGQCHAIRTRARPAEWQQDGFPFKPGEAIESCAPLHRFQETELRGPAGDAQRHLAEGSYWPDGMIRISGRDFSAMSTSACYKRGELSCLSCHSMHQYEDHDDQLSREGEGNAACVQCHTAYESQLEQHTHHKSGSSGSLCYNCHMPHTAYGLMKAIRSHQIDSPSIQSSIATGRPNACNLCHLDRSLGWAATALHTWYGRAVPALAADEHEISAAAKWILSGDAGQRAVVAWHFGWGPAAAASGRDWLAPYLAELLRDPYAVVRHVASRSLRRLKGFEDFPYDYIGPEVERGRASERALEIWNASARSQRPGGAAVLMDPSGSLDRERFSALVRRRNNRPLELLE